MVVVRCASDFPWLSRENEIKKINSEIFGIFEGYCGRAVNCINRKYIFICSFLSVLIYNKF